MLASCFLPLDQSDVGIGAIKYSVYRINDKKLFLVWLFVILYEKKAKLNNGEFLSFFTRDYNADRFLSAVKNPTYHCSPLDLFSAGGAAVSKPSPSSNGSYKSLSV